MIPRNILRDVGITIKIGITIILLFISLKVYYKLVVRYLCHIQSYSLIMITLFFIYFSFQQYCNCSEFWNNKYTYFITMFPEIFFLYKLY